MPEWGYWVTIAAMYWLGVRSHNTGSDAGLTKSGARLWPIVPILWKLHKAWQAAKRKAVLRRIRRKSRRWHAGSHNDR